MYEKYVQEYQMSQKIHPNFDFKGIEQPQLTQPPFQEEVIVEKTEP